MTTEEKAKAYDEALNKIKPLYEQAKKDDNPIWSTYEYLLPELRESEDKRIRKELIDQLQYIIPEEDEYDEEGLVLSQYYERISRYRAYLEKQKDASKAIEAVDRIDKYIDEHLANAHDMKDSNPDKKYYRGWDDALGKMAGILQDVYSNEKQKDQKPSLCNKCDKKTTCLDAKYDDGRAVEQCINFVEKEQKPAELNYDNRIQYDSVKSGIEAFASTYSFNIESKLFPQLTKEQQRLWREEIEQAVIAGGENGVELARDNRYKENRTIEWSEEDEEKLNSIFSILHYIGNFKFDSWIKSLPERFSPQPKQKWSDEDKKLLDLWLDVIDRNDWRMDENFCKASREFINKLKSLCPQPHWKPSEEQMDALNKARRFIPYNCDILESLYEQLKRL